MDLIQIVTWRKIDLRKRREPAHGLIRQEDYSRRTGRFGASFLDRFVGGKLSRRLGLEDTQFGQGKMEVVV
jgi:hypothetical protein